MSRALFFPLLLLFLIAASLAGAGGSTGVAPEVGEGGVAVAAEGVAFEAGDVVFRRGTGVLSRAVLALDEGSELSHVGIVVVAGGETFVVHAAPGPSLERRERVIREPLSAFLAPGKAVAAALYRPAAAYREVGERAAAIAASYVAEGRVFDAEFDLATQRELYCTELVWRAYLDAGLDLVAGELDRLSLPLHRGACLLPSRLRSSPYLNKVRDFRER